MSGLNPGQQAPRSRHGKKPFQPAIGTDFGKVEEVEARTRGFLARVFAIATVATIGVTGGYGFFAGNYTAVMAVWAIVGPFIGAMMSYYFGPRRNDTG
jgi:nitrate reductase NapE component